MKEAKYYEKINNKKVYCMLCPHNCTIGPGASGKCRVRKNVDGRLYSINYGKVTSLSLDPIEKKPLNRFKPGSKILSAGTFGCNLKCSFCQNWTIAQKLPDAMDVKPGHLLQKALELKDRGNEGIAYTYNEPFIWYEFVYDACIESNKEGLANVLVTNGFVSPEPLLDIIPYVDGMNIDVKAFTPMFYKDICGAALEPVKKTVEFCADKCHVEVTTLVIPNLNDDMHEIECLAKWLSSISKKIPLHLTRFFPNYKMTDKQKTPYETLIRARETALKYLDYVYLGNV